MQGDGHLVCLARYIPRLIVPKGAKYQFSTYMGPKVIIQVYAVDLQGLFGTKASSKVCGHARPPLAHRGIQLSWPAEKNFTSSRWEFLQIGGSCFEVPMRGMGGIQSCYLGPH